MFARELFCSPNVIPAANHPPCRQNSKTPEERKFTTCLPVHLFTHSAAAPASRPPTFPSSAPPRQSRLHCTHAASPCHQTFPPRSRSTTKLYHPPVRPHQQKKRGKGQPTNQQRRTRMPPNIPHQRPDLIPQPIPPPPPPPHPGPRRPRRPPNINPRRQRRVQIPHIHPPIKTPTIHISRIRTPRRRKVAPYQRPPYPVPAERHERVVVRVREPPRRVVVVAPAVLVRVRALVGDARRVEVLEALGRERHAQVPELHGLVFGVGEDVAPVAFGVEVGQAFDVPDEGAGGAGVAEGASVPDFNGAVVGAGVLGERGLVDLGGWWWGRRGLRGCGGRVCRQRRRR